MNLKSRASFDAITKTFINNKAKIFNIFTKYPIIPNKSVEYQNVWHILAIVGGGVMSSLGNSTICLSFTAPLKAKRKRKY